MDVFCSLCRAPDGVNPDDHSCLANLNKEAKRLGNLVDPSAWETWPSDKLHDIEQKLFETLRSIDSITTYYEKRINDAQAKKEAAYQARVVWVSPLNKLRGILRGRLKDLT